MGGAHLRYGDKRDQGNLLLQMGLDIGERAPQTWRFLPVRSLHFRRA